MIVVASEIHKNRCETKGICIYRAINDVQSLLELDEW